MIWAMATAGHLPRRSGVRVATVGFDRRGLFRRIRCEVSRFGGSIPDAAIPAFPPPLFPRGLVVHGSIHIGGGSTTRRLPRIACLIEVLDGLRRIDRDSLPQAIAFRQSAAATPPLVVARLTVQLHCSGVAFRHTLAGMIERCQNKTTFAIFAGARLLERVRSVALYQRYPS